MPMHPTFPGSILTLSSKHASASSVNIFLQVYLICPMWATCLVHLISGRAMNYNEPSRSHKWSHSVKLKGGGIGLCQWACLETNCNIITGPWLWNILYHYMNIAVARHMNFNRIWNETKVTFHWNV
jgi:hypothetical protein